MTWNHPIPPGTLEGYRRSAGATQEDMAHHMHMPFRTYQAIESGPNPTRHVHIRAAEAGLLFLARKRDDASFLPEHLKELVRDLAGLLDKTDDK